jgi:hypothetical protein
MTGIVLPGSWPRAERPLLDRGAERAAIDDLLNVVRRGFGGVLALRGGHGVGKTRLADYAGEAASGFQVSVIAGVESEIRLEYGAVHQLLIPFLPLVDDLPAPQREAIRGGVRPGGWPCHRRLFCRAGVPDAALACGVFRKLGITGRGQLARRLPGRWGVSRAADDAPMAQPAEGRRRSSWDFSPCPAAWPAVPAACRSRTTV